MRLRRLARSWREAAAAVLLSAMAVITFLNVLGRYFFHYSLAFTEELTINLFVWMVLVGSGLAFERGSQLGMVTIFRLFPARLRKGIILIGAVLSAALFIVVDVAIVHAIYYEITLFKATSPALGIPVWIYYAGIPVLSVGVFEGIAKGTFRHLRAESEEDA